MTAESARAPMVDFTIAAIPENKEDFTFISAKSLNLPRVGEHLHVPGQRSVYKVMAIIHHLDEPRPDPPMLYVERASIDAAIWARRVPEPE